MANYERTYGTGRLVCTVVEVLGWLVAVAGVVAFAVGFGMLMDSRNPYPWNVMEGLPAFALGLVLCFFGVLSIAGAQFTQATLDTAEMTRDIALMQREQLEIIRKIILRDN